MSDLSFFELEDIAWDEFCLTDDHMVPGDSEHANELLSHADSQNKPHNKAIGLSRTTGDQSTIKYAFNQRKVKEFPLLNGISTTMFENDSRADVPDAGFLSKHDKDRAKEVSSLASENTATSNLCFESNNIDSTSSEFHPNGFILDEKNAAVGEDSCYQLGAIPQSDNLSFFDSNHGDKNSNDLLYDHWPDRENFEDVDTMFRSCDSAFGLGACIEDDFGWFSSTDVTEGSGSGPRSDFQFPCLASRALENISGSREASMTKETGSSINDFGTKDQPLSQSVSSLPSENESAVLSHLSFLNGSSDSDCKILAQKKINMYKKHSKHHNQLEGKRKDVSLENGVQQQKKVYGPDFGYFQGGFSDLYSDQAMAAGVRTDEKKGEKLLPAAFGSSIVKERSLISAGMDEISEEAASFHQLQHITERLDVRTKLRIRDSLYRLSASAEQRQKHANPSNGSGDDRRTSEVGTGANRCTEYLDMEADTNSIDRSIAHLLFHRPSSNSSVMPDTSSLESPPMMYGSLTSPPMMGENLIYAGENAADIDRGIADN